MAVDGQQGLPGPDPRLMAGVPGATDWIFVRDMVPASLSWWSAPGQAAKRRKKEEGLPPLSFSLLVLLLYRNLAEHLAVVGHAGLAQPWGSRYAPHLGQVVTAGAASFQLARRLSRLCFETLLFGTAISRHLLGDALSGKVDWLLLSFY